MSPELPPPMAMFGVFWLFFLGPRTPHLLRFFTVGKFRPHTTQGSIIIIQISTVLAHPDQS